VSRSPKTDGLPGDRDRPRQRHAARNTPSSSAAAREVCHSSLPRAGRELPTVWAVCGFLLLAVALVFGRTVTYEFVNFDDPDYIYKTRT